MKRRTKEEKRKINKERVKSTLNKIIDLFKKGDVPQAIKMATFPPYRGLPSNEWSLANRLIMSNSDTSDARGVAQWRSIGRYPKKGSKAIHILAPKIVKKKKDKEVQESVKENQKKDNKFILVGFTPISIFRYEDTDGKEVEYEKHELPDFPLIKKAREWGISVREITFQGFSLGYYQSGWNEKIRLASPHESVFFHELSHAAHKRLKGKLIGKQDPKQEIVAELSAQVLSQLVGVEFTNTLGNSYEYISRYSSEINKDIGSACMSVLKEVESVLELILDIQKTID